MAWNRSTQQSSRQGAVSARRLSGKRKGIVMILCGIAIIVGGLSYLFFSQPSKPDEEFSRERALIRDVGVTNKHVNKKVPISIIVTNVAKENLSSPAVPPKSSRKCPLPPGSSILTMMDGRVVTNIHKQIYSNPFDQVWDIALRPSGLAATHLSALRARYGDQEILAELKEPTKIYPTDSEALQDHKRAVQQLKDDMLQAINEGRSIGDVLEEVSHYAQMGRMVEVQTRQIVGEAIKNGDAEGVRIAYETANQLRQQKGLKPLRLPDRYRDPEASGQNNGDQQ